MKVEKRITINQVFWEILKFAPPERETKRAKSEEEKAKKISQFMFKVISYANPAWYGEGARFGGRAQVIDALEDLSDKIDTEFAGEADVAAELHHKFSEVFLMAETGETAGQKEKLGQRQKFHALRALELRKQFRRNVSSRNFRTHGNGFRECRVNNFCVRRKKIIGGLLIYSQLVFNFFYA